MKIKFLAVFACGLVVGILAMLAASGRNSSEPIEPTVPPDAEQHEFNGMTFYIMPLAECRRS